MTSSQFVSGTTGSGTTCVWWSEFKLVLAELDQAGQVDRAAGNHLAGDHARTCIEPAGEDEAAGDRQAREVERHHDLLWSAARRCGPCHGRKGRVICVPWMAA